jgi:hypothetical protein
MSDYVAMNSIYAKYFSPPFPARTAIGVATLPLGPASRSISLSRPEAAHGG